MIFSKIFSKKTKDPNQKKEDIYELYFVQLVLITTLLRLIFSVLAEVKYEEAYYWCYAANLDWSYFDHPPMVGWLIYLSSQLGGQDELLVRIPAMILFAATLTMIFRLTTKMFSSKVGFITCAAACCLPAFEWYSIFMLPDAPLLFFWALGTYWGYRLIVEERPSAWWAVGAATGLGMLSKYPALLIPLAPILYLALEKRWKLLFNVHFFGAMTLALCLFSPVIYWNSQHEWCSFLFQSVSRFSEPKTTDFLNRFGGTWLNQVLILSPGGLILLIWSLVVAWKRRQEQAVKYLFCGALPFLAIVLGVSCIRLVQMNWPLPAYVCSIIIVGSELERRDLLHRRKALMALVFLPAILVSLMPLIGVLFPIGKLNRANELKGWKDLANVVMQDLNTMSDPQNTFIAGTGYQVSAEMAFYTGHPELVYCDNVWEKDSRNSKSFPYWKDVNALKGQDAVIVAYDELTSKGEWRERADFDEKECARHFQDFAKCEAFTVFYGGRPLRRYRIYLGHIYKGIE